MVCNKATSPGSRPTILGVGDRAEYVCSECSLCGLKVTSKSMNFYLSSWLTFGRNAPTEALPGPVSQAEKVVPLQVESPCGVKVPQKQSLTGLACLCRLIDSDNHISK